jgi:hypothetical protein
MVSWPVSRLSPALLAFFTLPSCSSSGSTPAPTVGMDVGAACSPQPGCRQGLGCGVDRSGARVCVHTCSSTYGSSILNGMPRLPPDTNAPCWDGLETPCQELPNDQTCGCGCSTGSYCSVSADQSTGQCVSAKAAGSPCDGPAQCQSGICASSAIDGGASCR